ncbi:MAG: response regulator, partial [Lachnospiraceae bacterium]|nr:response regulator [Lachnospiraceae bacterium]
ELFHAPEARILVVDDTEMNITVMQGLLKRTGIIIDTALSGHEALVLSEKNKYDVLFIDHMMPDMDGIETLNRIRETGLNIETPSVALTANAISGAREMYLDAGFNDYLSKPVEGAKLERMLLNLLPEKKIVTDEVAYSTPQSANDGTSLPAQLSKIPNLNTADGLKNCGGPEGYFSVLQVFHQTAIPKAEEIRKLWNENDFVNYTVKVHALKSSARIIGAAELSELAKKLEVAGKRLQEENTNEKTSDDSPLDFINDNTENLLSMYLSLNDSLSVLDKKNDALPDITPKALKEAYQTIAEIASAMDYGLMDEVLEHLGGYNLPPEDAERIAKIQARLMELDFEGISEILP